MGLLLFIIVTMSVATNSHVLSPEPAGSTEALLSEDKNNESQEFVVDLARNFSSFYFQVMTAFRGADRIVSPLSVFIPVSMLSYGVQGNTKKMFLDAIGLPENKTQMAKVGYAKFLDKLTEYNVQIKTKMFVPSGSQLKPEFVDLSTNVFNSEIEYVNVSDGLMDSGKINEWVAAQTNTTVTELFKPERIGRDPSIVLANTVHFRGNWKFPFNSSLTQLRPFHPVNGRAVNVPTMSMTGRFRHGRLEDFNATFIELPYMSKSEDDAMSMFIVLPYEEKYQEWLYLVFKLRNIDLNKLLNGTEEEVEVHLPKFKIESELSLNDIWKKIFNPDLSKIENYVNVAPSVTEIQNRMFSMFTGVRPKKINPPVRNYDPETADFSDIFESSKQSTHGVTTTKIVIEVDEQGHQTAESTGISYNSTESVSSNRKTRSVIPEAVQFVVNRPFLAMIVTKGKVPTTIFSINFPGIQFIPKGVGFW